MRKKCRAGRTSDFWTTLVLVILTCILLFISITTDYWGGDKVTAEEILVSVITMILLALLPFCLKETGCLIVMEKNKVMLKMPFRVLQTYSKEELDIRYGIRIYSGRAGISVWPCLMIGSRLPAELFVFRNNNYKKTDNEYFLFILNKRKLEFFIDWWGKEIALPDRLDWIEVYTEWLRFHKSDWQNCEKFYKTIEEYNQSIRNKSKG